MTLDPLDDFVLVHPEPQPSMSSLWTPPQSDLARAAIVIRGGDFTPGERVIVSLRQATQVGEDLLLPTAGILAKLG